MVCSCVYSCACSGDRVYSATHQFCSGHYSTDDLTDYLSVSWCVWSVCIILYHRTLSIL